MVHDIFFSLNSNMTQCHDNLPQKEDIEERVREIERYLSEKFSHSFSFFSLLNFEIHNINLEFSTY